MSEWDRDRCCSSCHCGTRSFRGFLFNKYVCKSWVAVLRTGWRAVNGCHEVICHVWSCPWVCLDGRERATDTDVVWESRYRTVRCSHRVGSCCVEARHALQRCSVALELDRSLGPSVWPPVTAWLRGDQSGRDSSDVNVRGAPASSPLSPAHEVCLRQVAHEHAPPRALQQRTGASRRCYI